MQWVELSCHFFFNFLPFLDVYFGLLTVSGKRRKLQTRPITAFLDLEGDSESIVTSLTNSRVVPRDTQQLNSQVTLSAIRQIIAQEVGRLETGFKQLQYDMGKAFNYLERRVDLKLSDITHEIDVLDLGQKEALNKVEKVKAYVAIVENRTIKSGTAFQMVLEDFKQLDVKLLAGF